MEKYTYAVAENFIRGFLKIFPAGSGVGDILFSMKDAREKQMLDESMVFFEERLSDISITELQNHKDIKDKLTQLGDKLNPLFDDYVLFLKQNAFITREMYVNVMNTLYTTNSKIDILDSKLDDIKKLLKGKNKKNDEILTNIFEEYLKKLAQQINEYNIHATLNEINQLKETDGFKELDEDLILGLKSLEGDIFIKLEKLEDAKIIANQFKAKDAYSERMCNFLIYYATVTGDEELKDKVISNYHILNVEKSKIMLNEAFYYFQQKDFRKAQSILSYEDNGNTFIRNELIAKGNSYYLLGMIKFYQKEYTEAENYLLISFRKKESTLTNYFMLLARAYNIIDKRSAIFTISGEDKNELQKVYNDLSDQKYLQDKFINIPHMSSDYWCQRLTILLHINPEEALNEFKNIPNEIKHLKNIRIIEADILFFNDQHEKAQEILISAYEQEKDLNLLTKIMGALLNQDKYDDVITFFSTLSPDDLDHEGIIVSLYLDALQTKIAQTELIKTALLYIESTSEPIYIYKFLGHYYDAQKDERQAKEYYRLSINAISKVNFPPRILFARDFFKKQYFELGFDCIRPMIKYDYNAKKLFVYHAIRDGSDSDINLASDLIDSELHTNYDSNFWLSAKAELEYNRNRFYTALKYIEKIFQKRKDEESSYRYVYLKLTTNASEFGEELDILEASKNPDYLMLAATCYNALGNQNKCESLSLLSLALNGNKINDNLFAQLIQLNMFRNPVEPEKVEFEQVNADCTIKLTSEKKELWLGITSNNTLLIHENNFTFVDTKFYNKRDTEIIHIIGANKFEEVQYEGSKYIISEIWAINTRAIRFILSYYDNPDNEPGFMKRISVNMEDPMESMKPMLVDLELHEKNILSMYNLSNKMGLPLNVLARDRGKNILDVIIHLLSMQSQPFYAGEVNNYDIENNDFILTPSSIALLALLGILEEVIDHFDNCKITTSTYDYFQNIITQHDDFEKRSKMSIGITNGRVFAQEVNDDFHKNRRKYFVDILSLISKIKRENVEVTPEELDDYRMLVTFISKSEYDCLKLASKNKMTHVSDDLVVRKARGLVGENILSTNSISIIFALYKSDLKKLLELLEKLSIGKYTYSFNIDIIIYVISKLLKEYHIIGSSSL